MYKRMTSFMPVSGWVLILIHAVWVLTHMSLHARGKLNPWELGGYAMYTTPYPRFQPRIYSLDEKGQKTDIPFSEHLKKQYVRDMSAGCVYKPKAFYKQLIEDLAPSGNRVIYVDFVQFEFLSLKPEARYLTAGKSRITFTQPGQAVIEEELCGENRQIAIEINSV